MTASSKLADPLYRFVDANDSEVVVYADRVVFRAEPEQSLFQTIEIAREKIVSVGNLSRKEWLPDLVVVLHRDEQGTLNYFVWPLIEKKMCRSVSNEIYKIIDKGFLKSCRGALYMFTHPLPKHLL